MEEKLFNPILIATPGKPAGKQQGTFKSSQGKASCLSLFSVQVCQAKLILDQMHDNVCCTNPVAGP